MNEDIMRICGFSQEVDNMKAGKCATCAGDVGLFKDALSVKEYRISGMCQKCQDGVFGYEITASYTYGDQREYIKRRLNEGYVIFNITSPALRTHDLDDISKFDASYFPPDSLITTSRSGGKHVYYVLEVDKHRNDIWAEKAVIQFAQGSDPRRELHTLRRRLINDPFAELMCELNEAKTVQKLQEYEKKNLGYFLSLEMFRNAE